MLYEKTLPSMSKRGYSREFPVPKDGRRYLLDHIPPQLWRQVKQKAKREGVSVRTLILRLLKSWLTHE
jgi:hypothetical protein